MGRKVIIQNKEALFNYEPLENYQAGLVLTGPEVKAVKGGQISLRGSYATINQSEVWLVNAYIAPYKPAQSQQEKYDPSRRRKLLLTKKEISSLIGKSKQKGLTIIPISVYTTKRLIKVELSLARGKSRADKRERIKQREITRQINRTLKQR